ncbi:MAG TPA: sulfate/molybdate ABC transporter ATP-binding protein [Polyangiaceae bacterium]|nr:sulfate/molybdate ABC transporter ATP-binding protein [Polyangiaceae bacterium]
MTVVVEQLSKHFPTGVAGRKVAAVSDVSFAAAPGSITSLLGPSGSGKSTLLRLIAGLEDPEGGKVMIGERDCTQVSPRERNVGFVFQSYALFRHMSIFDNIAFGMKIRKVSKADRKARVEELLHLVQLPGVGDRYPAQLSGGQRQRVALARALATEPKVLLLDEPFGALDTQVRIELRQWLIGFQEKTGVTTLLVTHDQEEAFELSQHVVLLHEGKVAQAGPPHELYDHPATPFVASFVGGANMLRGTVQSGQADVGAMSVRAPTGALDGSSVQAFVRPHDIKLTKGDDSHADVSLAKVERLTRVGAQVKVALELPSGESMTVQMPKTEVDALGLEAGDRVMVDLKDAKVFVEDYSI